MQININLYATFRQIAGQKSITVELPEGTSVLEAIRSAAKTVPVLLQHWFDASGELYPHVHIFLNGDDVSTLPNGSGTQLDPGAILEVFPPVAGG